MATQKQQEAVKQLVETRGNVSKAMRNAGYDDTTAKNPKNLTESKGFKEICDAVGLTETFVLDALTFDISNKPKNRKGELELATKVLGLYREKQELNIKGTLSLSDLFDKARAMGELPQ